MQHILRRRPFLVKNLENTVKKLLQLLEHYGAAERDKIAIVLSQVFIQKLGVPPENVFGVLLNDVLVAKGTSLSFVTCMFREWLRDASLEDLQAALRRGKVEERLLEFFPQQRRSADAFAAHFEAEGLHELVAHSRKRFADARARELRDALSELLSEGGGVGDACELLKQRKSKEGGLAEEACVGAAWEALLGAAQAGAKGAAQLPAALVKQLRGWAKLLAAAAPSRKGQAELLGRVQSSCYDDTALLKSFADIVRHLYDKDVLSEEAVLAWYKRGANPKGRAVFVKDLEKFVNWLQEAEEESDTEEQAATPAVVAAADAANAAGA